MSRLGSLLVRDAIVDVRVIEEAFQRQVLFGGSLDTVLLEMGALDDARLEEYLGRATGLPAGSLAMVRGAAAEFSAIPAERAMDACVLPVAWRGRRIAVFVTDATDRRRLDEIALAAGAELDPHVVSEVTFHLAAERVYGVAPPPRVEPLAATRRPLYAVLPSRGATGPVAAAEAPAEDRDSPFAVEPQPFDSSPLDFEAAVGVLRTAADRDAVLEALVRGLARRAVYAAVFVVHGSRALGRLCVRGPFADRDLMTRTEIALGEPSIFRDCVEAKRPLLCAVLAEGINHRIYADLNRAIPVAALLVPVAIRGKIVVIGYLDNATREPTGACVREASELGDHAAQALVRLIARAKAMALTPPPRPEPALPSEAARQARRPTPPRWGAALDPSGGVAAHPDAPTPVMRARTTTPPVVRAFEEELFAGSAESRRRAAGELRRAPSEAEHREVVERLRGEVSSPDVDRRMRAAETLGDLRDVTSLTSLILLLDDREQVAAAAHAALRLITREDLGRSRWRWRSWFDRNRSRHRIEWLIDALGHDDPDLRRGAYEDLAALTGERIGYDWDSPSAEREEARKRWRTWWQETGRKRHAP